MTPADIQSIENRFSKIAPRVDGWTLRIVEERYEELRVRNDIVEPPHHGSDLGVMLTLIDGAGTGYAATADISDEGLRSAAEQALGWARAAALHPIADASPQLPGQSGEYASDALQPWQDVSLASKLDRLRALNAAMRGDSIVERKAGLSYACVHSVLLASNGVRQSQRFSYLFPTLSASANRDNETLTRTFGGDAMARQGGLELLEEVEFEAAAERVARQAEALLGAEDCPTGRMDLVLAPDQMILQIHESIGHPLELDRILGDERNYAGTSFVGKDMFGTYQYGSKLLNVSFDPTRNGELASYAFDDEGEPARKELLIENGRLVRGLGGRTSQARLGLPGVANARASSWNRPAIDRMANLNLEPGETSFDALIEQVEDGVYLETNCSWSIDDARNKFQFGCEWGQRIRQGKLAEVVKKPSYRGVSATFWRSLAGVGNAASVETLGTPFCGKGEPNQIIRVGHASPPCLFRDVEVFGGE